MIFKVTPFMIDRWFSRVLILGLFWTAYKLMDWSWAFAGTAIAAEKPDLTGAAAVIAAVGVTPLAILTLAVNKYMELRALNRRKEDANAG